MHLLKDLPPGNVVVACFALEAAARLAQLAGNPITREEAEEWLESATPQPTCDQEWIEWRLDGIEELA